jgi:hypothetical protein
MSVQSRIDTIADRLSAISPTSEGASISSLGSVLMQYNPVPESQRMLSKSIMLYTRDVTDPANPKIIDESFQVTPGNFSPVKLNNSGGNRWVLAFGATGYGLKFHLPYGTVKNKIYITFCKRDSRYVDGWMDYTSAVTQEWIDAAITYFNRMPVNVADSTLGIATSRNFTSSSFANYKRYTLWANFRGLGPSSVAEGTQGKVSFTMMFVTDEATVEEGGTGGGSTLISTPTATPTTRESTTLTNVLSGLNTLNQR